MGRPVPRSAICMPSLAMPYSSAEEIERAWRFSARWGRYSSGRASRSAGGTGKSGSFRGGLQGVCQRGSPGRVPVPTPGGREAIAWGSRKGAKPQRGGRRGGIRSGAAHNQAQPRHSPLLSSHPPQLRALAALRALSRAQRPPATRPLAVPTGGGRDAIARDPAEAKPRGGAALRREAGPEKGDLAARIALILPAQRSPLRRPTCRESPSASRQGATRSDSAA